MLFSKQGMIQEKNLLEQTLQDVDAQITGIKLEHYEYLSHGTSTLGSQQVSNQITHKTPSRTASQTSSIRRRIMETRIREREEKRMQDIAIERMRTNAQFDA